MTPPDLPEWAFIRTVEPSPHDPSRALSRRHPLQARRPGAVSLQDDRLRRDLAVDHRFGRRQGDSGRRRGDSGRRRGDSGRRQGDSGRRLRTRGPGRPGVSRGTLRRDRDRAVRLPGRRCDVAEVALELPGHPGSTDLKVEGTDLVVATHGRSFWIVDDLTPLHREAAGGAAPAELYAPRRAWRLLPGVLDFLSATDGKDYSIGLGKPATFVATRGRIRSGTAAVPRRGRGGAGRRHRLLPPPGGSCRRRDEGRGRTPRPLPALPSPAADRNRPSPSRFTTPAAPSSGSSARSPRVTTP